MVAPRPIVILGPTAGGKSELAVKLAERLRAQHEPTAAPDDPPRRDDTAAGAASGGEASGAGGGGGGEVLGADSMQVYRHLDAGTAKPEPALRQRVPHHLIDIVEPTQRFTVADWLARAEAIIADLQRHGRTPIIVGGTNLYLKMLLEGMFDASAETGHAPAFRGSLDKLATGDLHDQLKRVDPAAGGRIHPNDRRRIVRALEVHHLTGRPISEQQQQWFAAPGHGPADRSDRPPGASASSGPPAYRHDPILIGLDWPREPINRRINARVKMMFEPVAFGLPDVESLPDEVRRLDAAGLLGPQAREALGYKQVLAAIAAERGRPSDRRITTMADAFEQTKVLTRRFAKQQRTWLRRFRGVHWLAAGEGTSPQALADAALACVEASDAAG